MKGKKKKNLTAAGHISLSKVLNAQRAACAGLQSRLKADSVCLFPVLGSRDGGVPTRFFCSRKKKKGKEGKQMGQATVGPIRLFWAFLENGLWLGQIRREHTA